MCRIIAGMLIVVAVGWPTSANADPPDYCPLYVGGQWNGVTYYYAVYRPNPLPLSCNMAQYYGIAASGDLRPLGTNCIDCTAPIRVMTLAKDEKVKKQSETGADCDTSPTQGSVDSLVLAAFVDRHTLGTPAGESSSAASTFSKTNSSAELIKVEVISDTEVYVMAKDPAVATPHAKKKRYFRLLEVLVLLPANADNPQMPKFDILRIGQELGDKPPNAIKFKRLGKAEGPDKKYHRIKIFDDENDTRQFNVLSKDDLEDPD